MRAQPSVIKRPVVDWPDGRVTVDMGPPVFALDRVPFKAEGLTAEPMGTFERWPLGDLQAKAKGLDLSAFHRDAPATAISGEAIGSGLARRTEPRLSGRSRQTWQEKPGPNCVLRP